MHDAIISIDHLGKRYQLRHVQKVPYHTFRESLSRGIRRTLSVGRASVVDSATQEDFWAIRDVSFEVNRGDVVGIIGRNGAGKSTLLKILSRITEPTTGRVTLRGRVASLLEVGTGFHPELTGRENISLNGAILGMTKPEIRSRFDEIVSFAEVEKFLDTPVKHYSSGMYVRLAFAVAAHLEPEILIVDEVLAVGDAEFQRKCLGKLGQVAGSGRTVLFVSHNLAVVQSLCRTVAVLDKGTLSYFGPTETGVARYWNQNATTNSTDLTNITLRSGSGHVRFKQLIYRSSTGEPLAGPICGMPVSVELEYESAAKSDLRGCRASIAFSSSSGTPLLIYSTEQTNPELTTVSSRGRVTCHIPRFPLTNGTYSVSIFFATGNTVQDWLDNALTCVVQDGDFFGTGATAPSGWTGKCVLSPHSWSHECQSRSDGTYSYDYDQPTVTIDSNK